MTHLQIFLMQIHVYSYKSGKCYSNQISSLITWSKNHQWVHCNGNLMASFTWKLDLNFNCAFALKSLLPCKYEQINWPHVSFSHFIFSPWQQNKYEKINHLKYIKSRGYDYVKLMPIRHIYASSIFVLMKFPA